MMEVLMSNIEFELFKLFKIKIKKYTTVMEVLMNAEAEQTSNMSSGWKRELLQSIWKTRSN